MPEEKKAAMKDFAAAAAAAAALTACLGIMSLLKGWYLWAAVGLSAAAFVLLGYRTLTSLPFAALLLALLLSATALGTFVPRETSLRIFHSTAYRGLLASLAACMVLVVVRRRAWRISEWGILLAHSGVAVVLAGGLIGNLWGVKGFIAIHEGRTVRSMELRVDAGGGRGGEADLGFELRLDKFEIERRPPDYRLYAYRQEEDRLKAVSSTGLKDAGKWIRAGGGDVHYRLLEAYPDFELRAELNEKPEGTGPPALRLRSAGPDGGTATETLLAGVAGRDEMRVDEGRTAIRFVADDVSAAPRWPDRSPEAHLIVFRKDEGAAAEEMRVKPGERHVAGGGAVEITVLEHYADFVYDTRERRAFSRSDQPRNPALRVSLREAGTGRTEERWLFANDPDFDLRHGRRTGAGELRYIYLPAREPAEREIVAVGKSREIVEYFRGTRRGRAALVEGAEVAPASRVFVERLLAAAEEVLRPATRSSQWARPVARIEAREGDQLREAFIAADEPVRLGSTGYVLVFKKKADDVKAYRSSVSILEGGRAVRRGTISVNNPLAHRGFLFYQSDHRPEDPTYSGILVVKDPGLGIAYAGFAMVCLGAILCFYVRPRPRGARA